LGSNPLNSDTGFVMVRWLSFRTAGLRNSPLFYLPLSDMVTTPVVWCMVVTLKSLTTVFTLDQRLPTLYR
jgi:hypothetical protein